MFSQACLAERGRRGKERGFLLRGRVGPWEHLAGKSTWGGQGQRGRMIGIDVQNQSSDCQSQSSKRNAIEKKKRRIGDELLEIQIIKRERFSDRY